MTCNGPATSSEGYRAGLLWERIIWNTLSSTFGQLMSIATHWKGKGFSCSVLRCWLHSHLKDQEQLWRVALEESEGLVKLSACWCLRLRIRLPPNRGKCRLSAPHRFLQYISIALHSSSCFLHIPSALAQLTQTLTCTPATQAAQL